MKVQKFCQMIVLLVFASACNVAGTCTIGSAADCPSDAFCYGGEEAKAGDSGICTLLSSTELSISSFSPLEASHGTTLTLRGTNFSPVPSENSVTFNGVPAFLLSAIPDEIKVVVPQNTLCSGPIRVTVSGKTVSSSSPFVYIPTAANVSTFAGDGNTTMLNAPCDIATDMAGNFYVTEYANHRIRKITPEGDASTFAGGNASSSGYVDATGTEARFKSPWGITLDVEGNFYITDGPSEEGRIRRISPEGVVSTLANGMQGFRTNPENVERFNNPRGIVRDTDGNFYVVDTDNHRIRKISPEGFVSTFAGKGSPGSADGQGELAEFRSPRGIAIDAENNLYVADRENNRIRKISPAGVVSTLADKAQGFVANPENVMSFQIPHGLTCDKAGNLYVAETGSHRIQQVTPSGRKIPLAGNGAPGFADGESGESLNAQFNAPRGIISDKEGNLYVADYLNNRIRKITLE